MMTKPSPSPDPPAAPGRPAADLPRPRPHAVPDQPVGPQHSAGQQSALPAFAGPQEAMAALEAALTFLAGAEAADLPAATLADCLRGFARADSVQVAARSRFVTAFTAQSGPEADGHPTARSWLRWQTRVTRAAASTDVAWSRRLAAHPVVAQALAAAILSPSWARQICDWTDKLPPAVRADADAILVAAAVDGADLATLSGLAEELFRRTAPPSPDGPPSGDEDGFADRRLILDLHFRGAGRLDGDLTPECSAALLTALDALSKRTGPEDDRSQSQRHHDALEELCRRQIAIGLPDTAGQPTQIHLHATLDQLQGLTTPPPAAPPATDPPATGLPGIGQPGGDTTGAWLAGRAAGDGEPGWLSGPAAEAYACDAKITPIITGYVDPAALADAVQAIQAALVAVGTAASTSVLTDTLLPHAIAILSGPRGLAARLRATAPGPLGTGISLPLDVGTATATIPPHLRRAVATRDRHCAFAGCHQPPSACQVHHVIPRSRGGPTAVTNLVLLCSFHHLVAIHRWGWALVLNPDGTTTATSPDGHRVYRSHGPPAAAAA